MLLFLFVCLFILTPSLPPFYFGQEWFWKSASSTVQFLSVTDLKAHHFLLFCKRDVKVDVPQTLSNVQSKQNYSSLSFLLWRKKWFYLFIYLFALCHFVRTFCFTVFTETIELGMCLFVLVIIIFWFVWHYVKQLKDQECTLGTYLTATGLYCRMRTHWMQCIF